MADTSENTQSRLDTIIRLLAAPLIQGKTTAEAVRLLATLRIDTTQIAVICGVAPNVVRARLSEVKKGQPKAKSRTPRPRSKGE